MNWPKDSSVGAYWIDDDQYDLTKVPVRFLVPSSRVLRDASYGCSFNRVTFRISYLSIFRCVQIIGTGMLPDE